MSEEAAPEVKPLMETPSLVSQAQTPPETPAAEPAPAEEAPATPSFKLEDLKAPEGFEGLEEFYEKTKDLPGETAQRLLDEYSTKVREAVEAVHKPFIELNQQWIAEVQADPEIGGEKLKAEVFPAISKLIDRFGGDKVRAALDLTGAGNNPDIIRFAYSIAKALNAPTNAVQGTPPAQVRPKDAAAAMYPELAKGSN